MAKSRESTNKVKNRIIISLFFSKIVLLLLIFSHTAAEAQCVGGNSSDVICGANQTLNFQGSDQFGFDQSLVLLPAAANKDPLAGPCLVCSDGTISATSGAYTDSMFGEVRLPGMANKGDLARSPEAQGIILPTDPGGDGPIPIISLPLAPFGSFEFTFTDPNSFAVNTETVGIASIDTTGNPPSGAFSFNFSGDTFLPAGEGQGTANGSPGSSFITPGLGTGPGTGNQFVFDPSDINFDFVDPGFDTGF